MRKKSDFAGLNAEKTEILLQISQLEKITIFKTLPIGVKITMDVQCVQVYHRGHMYD
jgi:hypothetical protein